MHKLLTVGVLAAVLSGASAAQALGPNGEIVPTFRTERQYAHCSGPSKVQNVAYVQGQFSPLNTTAPTASVQSGAGCGTAGPSVITGTAADAVWTGTFTGNLKAITVEVHDIYVGAGRATRSVGITPTLTLDGASAFTPAVVRVVPVASATGASEKLLFTITGLDKKIELEDGNGETVHTIRLQLHGAYADSNTVNALVWDTTEVPSGITVNPATIEAATISAG